MYVTWLPLSRACIRALTLHLRWSLNHEGRWGTTDDFTTSFLQFPPFFTALRDLANSRPVHSLMFSHWRTPGLSIPWCFPTSFSVFLVFFPFSRPEMSLCGWQDFKIQELTSSFFHCALHDGFGRTWWTGDISIPLQFASLYDGQEVFVWSDCLLDLGTDFLVDNMVFVWGAQYLAVQPRFHGSYSSSQPCCEDPWFTSIQEEGCDKAAHQS